MGGVAEEGRRWCASWGMVLTSSYIARIWSDMSAVRKGKEKALKRQGKGQANGFLARAGQGFGPVWGGQGA